MDGSARNVSVPVVLVCGSLAVGVLLQGAFHPPGRLVLGVGVAAAVAVAVWSRRPDRRELAWGPLLGVSGCALWTLLGGALNGSTAAGIAGTAAWLAVGAVLFVVRRSTAGERETVVAVIVLLGAALAATSWLGLVLHLPRWALQAAGVWRGSGALTYPNATAAVLAVAALLAIGHGSSRSPAPDGGPDGGGRPLLPPAACAALATGILAGLAATLSRGGAVALVAGLVAGLAVAGPGRRAFARSAAGPLAGGALAGVGLLPLTTGQGAAPAVLAVVSLGAGLALALAARGPVRRGPHARRRACAVAAVLVTGVLAGAAVLTGPHLQQLTGTRLHLGSGHRAGAAGAALAQVREHPLIGVGPGRGTVTWHEADGAARTARYLHDEYLQVALELGAIGAGLLVLLAVLAARDARRRDPPRPGEWAARRAGCAATVAFAVHSGLDFLWHLPALPVLAAAVFAATLASGVPGRPPGRSPVVAQILPEAPVASGRLQGREDPS